MSLHPSPVCEALQGLLLPLLQGPPHRLLPPTASPKTGSFVLLQAVHTYSSSVMDSWQLSQTLTSNSKPIRGMEERLELHLPQTAFPHLRQWCCRRQRAKRRLQPQAQKKKSTARALPALPSHFSRTRLRLQHTEKPLFQGR